MKVIEQLWGTWMVRRKCMSMMNQIWHKSWSLWADASCVWVLQVSCDIVVSRTLVPLDGYGMDLAWVSEASLPPVNYFIMKIILSKQKKILSNFCLPCLICFKESSLMGLGSVINVGFALISFFPLTEISIWGRHFHQVPIWTRAQGNGRLKTQHGQAQCETVGTGN